MIRMAHLVHPGVVPAGSDLVVAQPVTFQAMRLAREFARNDPQVEVDLLAAQHADEPRVPLPDCFRRTADISRSATDIKPFRIVRKLALIQDLLDRLHHDSGRADYLIYSNVDIAPQPYFYLTVAACIRQGLDAFIVNRRTIPGHYDSPSQLPLMYAEPGDKHPGWDCFVFKRSLYPHFQLGQVLIGSSWFGRAMICNLALLAERFKIFEDLHLTFHIGNRRVWKDENLADYNLHNREECRKILNHYDTLRGPLDRDELPGRFFRLLDRE